MLTVQHPHADHLAAEAVDSLGRDATTDRAVAPVASKNSQGIPSHARYLVGGFFVLIALILLTPTFPQRGIEYGIPNDALAALILRADSPAQDALIHLMPTLTTLKVLSNYDIALVAQREPFALHLVAHTPRPEDLLALSEAGLPIASVGDRLVVIGDQAAAANFKEHARLPWWTRLRVAGAKKQHAGALLFAQDAQSPWLLGRLEEYDSALRLTVPFTEARHYTIRMLESDVQETLFNLTHLLLPAAFPLKLPDNSVVQELRTETAALSWAIKEENGQTYTLFQNNAPVFSYARLIRDSDCSNIPVQRGVTVSTHHPLPELNLEISLLKQAILFCISNGDKL